MQLTTVFNKLLCLQGAQVRSVVFNYDILEVTVSQRARRHHCPKCSFCIRAGYDHHDRQWRHIALGKWRVVIRSTVYRLTCPRHGVVTEKVPWAAPGSRFTLDFEDLVAWTAKTMDKTAVTRLLHIAWASVGHIVERVVGRTLNQHRLDHLYAIGIDEVSYRKGHKYLTVIADHQRGDVVFATQGRTRESVGRFFDEMGPQRCEQVAAVTMDMSAPFIAEVQARVPNAEIAFDPFHVVKLANEAVQQVRRCEARQYKGLPQAQVLKGAMWSLLKAPEALKPQEQVRLSEVAALNQRVYRGYLLKEELRALYHCPMETAESHLDSWLTWASRSKLPAFVKVARTLRTYKEGVLAAIRLGLSNGRLEGINNKVGVIKRRAYGFHSAAALIAMVYLCCTHIAVKLPI